MTGLDTWLIVTILLAIKGDTSRTNGGNHFFNGLSGVMFILWVGLVGKEMGLK